MKAEAERAIRTLDELIAWLAKKGIIKNQPALDRLTEALKVVAENCEHENAEKECEINALSQKVHKLRLALKCCGFTTKGIMNLMDDFTEEDLDNYAQYYAKHPNPLPLNHPLAQDHLRIETRIKNELKNQEWN